MALVKGDMQRFIGGKVTMYLYSTNDTLVQVAAANYFDSMADELSVGDIILVSADLDGTPATQHYMVSANTGTAVTVVASA